MPNPDRTRGESEPIADAASLFDTAPIPVVPDPPVPPRQDADFGTDEIRVVNWSPPPEPTPAPIRSRPAPTPTPKAAPVVPDDDEYGLIGGPAEEVAEAPPRPVALPTPEKKVRRVVEEPQPVEVRKRPRPDVDDEDPEPPRRRRRKGADADSSEEDAVADPLWTRWAEWGGTAIRVGSAVLGTLFLAFLLLRADYWGTAFLVVLLGFAGAVLLSYPILVTMERPVRITPEQAVKDFYAAASHHFPHYKRMWLLLSSAGRDAGPFRSFDAFRSAWERQVSQWKGTRIKKYAPLDFQVQDFRADKSVGQTSVWAEYTLRIKARDPSATETLASIRMAHGLVKGDDRMWYLNRGLPIPGDGD